MRNQPETVHEYNIPRLNWWFLISGLLFLGCLVLMIWVDYSGGKLQWLGLKGDRQWKNYQREFYKLETHRLAADKRAAELRAEEQGLAKLKEQLAQARTELAAKQDIERTIRTELATAQTRASLITREFTIEKATRDEIRSAYEAVLHEHNLNQEADAVRAALRRVRAQNQRVDDLDLEKQVADAKVADLEARLAAIIGEEEELARRITRMTGSIDLVNKRLRELSSPLVQGVVNAPVIEFAQPTIRVEQIVAEKHHVDVNFATVPRVDRCTTCHKAIDRKDPTPEEAAWRKKHKIESTEWSKLPQPLAAHPRLDLYVSDNSPHPAGTYGCTVCHWGWDRETDFSRAGHTPDGRVKQPHIFDEATGRWIRAQADDEEEDEDTGKKPKVQTVALTQREAWEKNYHWEHQEFLAQPMRNQKYVQASCLKCHQNQTHLPGGETLDNGRRLIGQLGCWSCHKMKQMETYSLHKVAPGEDFDSLCKTFDVEPDQLRRINNLPKDARLTVGQELSIPIRILHKTGPGLRKISGKTDKLWTRKWLEDPVAFRPNTYMPKFWGLDNNTDPDRDAVEINAVTEFLFTVSDASPYPTVSVPGDPARGQELVGQLGCLACHVVDERVTELKPPPAVAKTMSAWEYRRARSQGPQLFGTGSKTTKEWIFAWVKNPKQYHPHTKMPDLRLSDQEAADVAEYLVSLRAPATDAKNVPLVKEHRLDDVTLEYLQVNLPRAQAEKKIHALDDLIEPYFVDEETRRYYDDPTRLAREEAQLKKLQQEFEDTLDDAVERKAKKLEAELADVKAKMAAAHHRVAGFSATEKKNLFLGSKLISRYGCYACHDIQGFENAKPIGAELSEWGSKPVSKLDFGLLNLEHDRIAWLEQKLRAPRSYDLGRIGITRTPQEHLKMPKFNLTDEQIDQIITFVSGMTDEKLTFEEPRALTPAEFQIERGRWLAKELNCAACHILEGRGGAIRSTITTPGMEPPLVSGKPGQLRQGQRTNPDWLFRFLKRPVTGEVRPWLKVRMPTFGLSDAEANILVRYFALEGKTQFPFKSPPVHPTPEHLAIGKRMFEGLECGKCHIVEGKAKGKPLAEIPADQLADLAPNLSMARERLQRDWLIHKWLPDPQSQVPGVKMPQFDYSQLPAKIIPPETYGGDAKKRIEALVDYILTIGAEVPPGTQAAK
jgi:cytochrome c2